MGPSSGNWLAAHRADLTLAKTAICIFVAKFYGRMPIDTFGLLGNVLNKTKLI